MARARKRGWDWQKDSCEKIAVKRKVQESRKVDFKLLKDKQHLFCRHSEENSEKDEVTARERTNQDFQSQWIKGYD